jgi:uncharacterized protein YdhG (YjbR/CyaY superfamily)
VAQHFESVDDYISTFPPDVQTVLRAARNTIHAAAPGAKESISYQIPTFSISGRPVVYLAGWKKHISLYPMPELDEALGSQVAPYLSGQSTAKFPLAKPIPHELITDLVQSVPRVVSQESQDLVAGGCRALPTQ